MYKKNPKRHVLTLRVFWWYATPHLILNFGAHIFFFDAFLDL